MNNSSNDIIISFSAINTVITLLIIVLSYYGWKVFKFNGFKFLLWGWIINFLLLLLSLINRNTDNAFLNQILSYDSLFFIPAYFFLIGSISIKKDGKGKYIWFERNKNYIIPITSLLLAVILFFDVTDLSQRIPHLHLVVTSLLSLFCYLSLAIYYNQIEKNLLLNFHFLTIGTLLFIITQLAIPITEEFYFLFPFIFFIAVISKIIMLLGLSFIFISESSKNIQQKELAHKLDIILGRTFHELIPPLNDLDNSITQIDNNNEDIFINKKGEMIIARISNSFQRVMAIINASIRSYEFSGYIENFTLKNLNRVDKNPVSISINVLLEIALQSIKNNIDREKIYFHVNYVANCNIVCFKNEVLQVFVNIIKNSVESIKNSNGIISIKSSKANDIIRAEIKDNGIGISKQIMNHIFEQGFSTKNTEAISGYGLSVVHEFLDRNQGTISIESDGVDGTTVIIEFLKAKTYER